MKSGPCSIKDEVDIWGGSYRHGERFSWFSQTSSLSFKANDQKHILRRGPLLRSSMCLWSLHANETDYIIDSYENRLSPTNFAIWLILSSASWTTLPVIDCQSIPSSWKHVVTFRAKLKCWEHLDRRSEQNQFHWQACRWEHCEHSKLSMMMS